MLSDTKRGVNRILAPSTIKTISGNMAIGVGIVLAYYFLKIISRKYVVSQARTVARAHWQEQARLNKIRLFGSEDI